ncbi:MAG: hypothetical protein H7Z16_03410 [Pyrinomonadaceae bacterium]|nr:hypothetical protein [Pyrinomonadaceae bacterium]
MKRPKSQRTAILILLFVAAFGMTSLAIWGGGRASVAKAQAKPKPAFEKTKFTPACENPSFPMPAPASAPAIDSLCGLAGTGGAGPEGVQDMVKNNFCAKGTPEEVTIDDLVGLQSKVVKAKPAINFGSAGSPGRAKGPTANRAPLKKLGEGKLVTLSKVFVLIARQEGGESVNCGKNVDNHAALHDIHISLVSSPRVTNECSSVVAEMSPHHRPDSWNHGNVAKVAAAKLPVRVTGQLYFDSSHFPCSGGKGKGQGNPKRKSLWEIHPIYKFEVCTADCDGDGTWVTLDKWAEQ